MSPKLKHWLGLLLIVVSVVSLALTSAGLIGLWAFKPNVVAAVTRTVSLLSSTLQTTSQALDVAGNVLDEAHRSMATLVGTTELIGSTLRDGQPALKSASDLLKQDLPNALEAAQTSIESAVKTAQGIDTLLSNLAKIPLIQLDYRPDVPFGDSLAGIGHTLDGLPAKLSNIGGQIDRLNGDVGTMANQVDGMTGSLRQIDTTLSSARGVLQDYQQQLSNAAPALQSIANRADLIILATYLILTFILVWIAAVQLITLGVGLRAWKRA